MAYTIRPKRINVTMDKAVSQQLVKHIAQRALDIERYILRRAWGTCYAIVASEILLTAFLPVLFGAAGLASEYGFAVRLIVNTVISLAGVAVAFWIFKKAYNAMLVRREITDSVWSKILRPWRIALVWLAYYAPIVIAIFFLRQYALAVLFGFLAAQTFPFFFALKFSFPEKLPREGIAVLAAFLVCMLGNLTISLLRASFGAYLAVLGVLSAVFLSAAVYVYRQKPPNPPEDYSEW
jgi:hypothetical protein